MSDAQSDAELVEKIIGGDLSAFGVLVSRYQQVVCAVAFSACGSRALSEDVAQETFISAWKNITKLEDTNKLKGWLCSIARNRSRDALRKGHREVLSADSVEESVEFKAAQDPAPSPLENTVRAEDEQQMWQALREIPETYREPLVLFYRDGQSIHQVAEGLDLSISAAKQRLSRGRTALRESLTQVSTCLARTRPTTAFSVAVIAAVAAQVGVAEAASMTHSTTKLSKVGLKRFGALAQLTLAGAVLLIVAVAGWVFSASSQEKPGNIKPSTSAKAKSSFKPVPKNQAATRRFQITGQVLDLFEQPVVSATVTIGQNPPQIAHTDTVGRFHFPSVGIGSYEIEARTQDGASRPQALHIAEDQNNIALHIVQGASLQIDLLDGNQPAPQGIEVELETGATVLTATTNEQGYVEFQGITAILSSIRVKHDGFAALESVLNLSGEPGLHKRRIRLVQGIPLQGTVANEEGLPIEGVEIHLESNISPTRKETVMSDAEGNWAFSTVPAESCFLLVTHREYTWVTRPLHLEGIQEAEPVALTMTRGKQAHGQVLYSDGSPARAATVVASFSKKSTLTDSAGSFHLLGLEPGDTHLQARSRVFASHRVKLADGEDTKALRLTLENHSVRGVVVDENDEPVAGAQVLARHQEAERLEQEGETQPSVAQAITDRSGSFTLGPLPGGATFDVVAVMPGVSPAYLHLAGMQPVIAKSGQGDIRLQLASTGQLRGRVHGDTGTLNAFAITIAVYSATLSAEPSSPFLETDGIFGLTRVPAGTYTVAIVAKGYKPKILDQVQVKSGEHTNLGDVHLSKGNRLQGRVVDAAGVGIVNARVLAGPFTYASETEIIALQDSPDEGADPFTLSDASEVETRSDKDGYFQLENLHARGHELFVIAEVRGVGRSQQISIEGMPQHIELSIQPGATIKGELLGGHKDVFVHAIPLDSSSKYRPMLVNGETNDKHYALENLAPGRYRVLAHTNQDSPDYERGLELTLTAGQILEVALEATTDVRPAWSQEAIGKLGKHVDALCNCESQACRALEDEELHNIDSQFGPMTAAQYDQIAGLQLKAKHCDGQ